MKLLATAFSIGFKIGRKLKQLWEVITDIWCNSPQDEFCFVMEMLGR